MSELLDDKLNLLLLQEICSGNGLEVNLAYLSRLLKRHRNTVRDRVSSLISHGVIDRPVVPFLGLFRERPLLAVIYADLPETKKITEWIRGDTNIFGAYRVRDGEYNTMLFTFHTDLWEYQVWRDSLVKGGKIPERRLRAPSSTLYFSNKLIEKYQPNAAIDLIEQQFARKGEIEINGYFLDRLAVNILKLLLDGRGIRMNESYLSTKLGMHRSTIRRRTLRMQQRELIHQPLCRFPLFFTPPNFLLVFSMLEVREPEKFLRDVNRDPHVGLAYNISEGRYNMLLFESHLSIEDYLRWERTYESKYRKCFGSIKNNYLSPRMNVTIDQQKVSLGAIREKLKRLEEKS